MEKLDFKQEFTIHGIPVLMATEHSFRGVFLAGELLGILLHEFGEEIIVFSTVDSKDTDHD